ncbi:MAG: catalase, partial [bacterium]|nr:catalase [bacterium]
IGGGCPFLASMKDGAYQHFPQPVVGVKQRVRAESFGDHYSQATLFLESQSPAERAHLTKACQFELGKVTRPEIRARAVAELANIDLPLATEVAVGLGLPAPKKASRPQKPKSGKSVDRSPALSIEQTPNKPPPGIKGRKVAVLVAEGVDEAALATVRAALDKGGAVVELVARMLGTVAGSDRKALAVDKTYLTSGGSVMYDAVFVPGGAAAARTLATHGDAKHFVNEAFKHCKPLGAIGDGIELLRASQIGVDGAGERVVSDAGLVTAAARDAKGFARAFVGAIGQHRFWEREADESVPA